MTFLTNVNPANLMDEWVLDRLRPFYLSIPFIVLSLLISETHFCSASRRPSDTEEYTDCSLVSFVCFEYAVNYLERVTAEQ